MSATADHSLFVFSASTFDHPHGDLCGQAGHGDDIGPAGWVTQLSHFNDGVEPAWGKTVSLSWKSDSFRVQGWLMLPKDYDPAEEVSADRGGAWGAGCGGGGALGRRAGG